MRQPSVQWCTDFVECRAGVLDVLGLQYFMKDGIFWSHFDFTGPDSWNNPIEGNGVMLIFAR